MEQQPTPIPTPVQPVDVEKTLEVTTKETELELLKKKQELERKELDTISNQANSLAFIRGLKTDEMSENTKDLIKLVTSKEGDYSVLENDIKKIIIENEFKPFLKDKALSELRQKQLKMSSKEDIEAIYLFFQEEKERELIAKISDSGQGGVKNNVDTIFEEVYGATLKRA